MNFKNILVSCSDKSGLAEFIRPLAEAGARVVSTGGTSKYLEENGVQVTPIQEQTGYPEVMDGRVRTLHPNVHVPLLARDDRDDDQKTLSDLKLKKFDLVVCNLYPFESALEKGITDEELVEFIDIGGPTLLRAAAKNFKFVLPVVDPTDYEKILSTPELSQQERGHLAAKVFKHVSSYDAMIANALNSEIEREHSLGGELIQELRYGENPQQRGFWFREKGAMGGLHMANILQGKPLSYNNILDIDAAVQSVRLFDQPTCVALKHNNPCGVAQDTNIETAVAKAIGADSVSVFGGVIAINREVNKKAAEKLTSLFLEAIIAPSYDSEALKVLEKKKRLRVMAWPDLEGNYNQNTMKTVTGGYLVQSLDTVQPWGPDWKVVGEAPTDRIREDIAFIWRVVSRLKSNAIAIGKDFQTLGLGMGQVNRVDAVQQSIERWKSQHNNVNGNVILASDAFFPFPDSIELAHKAGVKWVVQPGGSIKDDDVIAKANELGVNMILTGVRHFLH